MKTKYKIISILMILIALLLLPTVSKAQASSVTLTEIKVTTPAGTYNTGDTITFEAIFSGNIQKYDDTVPYLNIKFGTSENWGDAYIREGVISGNKITYTYTVESDVSGALSLKGFSGLLKDASGDTINITAPSALTGNAITVNPITWTNKQNINVSIVDKNGDGESFDVNVTGLDNKDGHKYYAVFANSETMPTINKRENGKIETGDDVLDLAGNVSINKYIGKAGNIYMWIYEEQIDYAETGKYVQELILEKKELTRPAQRALGQRIQMFLFDDYTSSYFWQPHDLNDEENMMIKISVGKVTKSSLIADVVNRKSDGLSNLLAYAKTATPEYTVTVPLGRSDEIVSKMPLINDAYYYVYFQLVDNGIYYPVEDIDLYEAMKLSNGALWLYDYTSSEFSYNDGGTENGGGDGTVLPEQKIPQTEEETLIIGLILIVAVSTVVVVKKFRDYKDIK